MKKLFYAIAVFGLAVTSSCSDDDDKTYQKSDLIGSWEQIGGNEFVACPDGDNAKIEITEDKLKTYAADENGCSTTTGLKQDYTFDGKVLTVTSVIGKNEMKIEELSENKLVINNKLFFGDQEVGTIKQEYSKLK